MHFLSSLAAPSVPSGSILNFRLKIRFSLENKKKENGGFFAFDALRVAFVIFWDKYSKTRYFEKKKMTMEDYNL